MAVSLALRGAKGVGEETRARVNQAARELGYQPDPTLNRALEVLRRSANREHPIVVGLVTHGPGDQWNRHPTLRQYAAGIRARASELGFDVQLFERFTDGMSDRRLSNILSARGIESVILAPLPVELLGKPIELDWSRFVAIVLGQSIQTPALHRVSQNYFHAVTLAYRETAKRGYRRIALGISQPQSIRSGGRWLGGFLKAELERKREQVPVFLGKDGERESFLTWVEKVEPDAIIGLDLRIVEWLREAGYRVPEDIGFVHPGLREDYLEDGIAGVVPQNFIIGQAAVSLIAGTFIGQSSNRPPRVPKTVDVAGEWSSGWSLPRRAASVASRREAKGGLA